MTVRSVRLSALLGGFLVLACEAPSERVPPPYATLVQTCAPWDGPAVALFLTDQPAVGYPPPPYHAIMVYRGVSEVLGHRFDVGTETQNLGSAQVCLVNTECRQAGSAAITFGGMGADSTVQVTYRLDLGPDGSLKGKALARLHPAPALCG